MTRMYAFVKLDRRSFLNWLAGSGEPKVAISHPDMEWVLGLNSGEIALVWADQPAGPEDPRRPIIVVSDSSLNDFLAWTSTYVKSFAPFTAFFRVISSSHISAMIVDQREQSRLFDELLLGKLSGVVIAEAVSQAAQPTKRLDSLSLQACQATFSYAVLQGYFSNMHPADLSDLGEEWMRARGISSDASTRLDGNYLSSFWMIASHALLSRSRPRVTSGGWTDAIEELVYISKHDGDLFESLAWNLLSRDLKGYTNPSKILFDMPREDQLIFLDNTARTLGGSDVPMFLAEAWLGMLAARLGNGSFEYLGLLDNVRDRFPGASIWFALFSVWRPGFDGLIVGNCLGRRVAREISAPRNLFEAPTCDIALSEYEVLARGGWLASVRSAIASSIEVELRPLVAAKFRIASKARGDRTEGSSVDILKLRRALVDALQALDVSSNAKIGSRYDQQRLFEEPLPTRANRTKKK